MDIDQEREFAYAGTAEPARQLARSMESPVWPAVRRPAPWRRSAPGTKRVA